jgi:hypothetical protein
MTIPTSGSKVEGSGLTRGSFYPPFRLLFFFFQGLDGPVLHAGAYGTKQFNVLRDTPGSL